MIPIDHWTLEAYKRVSNLHFDRRVPIALLLRVKIGEKMILQRIEYLAAESSFGIYRELLDAQRWISTDSRLVVSNVQVFQSTTIDPHPWKAFLFVSFRSPEAQDQYMAEQHLAA